MQLLWFFGTAAVAFVAMELWAGILHRFVWHRSLWSVHRTHHRRSSGLESNDALSVLHAPIAIVMFALAVFVLDGTAAVVVGGWAFGMTMFGMAYLVVHDGLVHGRLPVASLARVGYFAKVKAAHEAHHRRNDTPYGLFLGPVALAISEAREAREARTTAPAPLRIVEGATVAPVDSVLHH